MLALAARLSGETPVAVARCLRCQQPEPRHGFAPGGQVCWTCRSREPAPVWDGVERRKALRQEE